MKHCRCLLTPRPSLGSTVGATAEQSRDTIAAFMVDLWNGINKQ